MKNEMQRQLTDNIKKRGQLESLPFCALTQNETRIEIISGHHRIRSAKEALKEPDAELDKYLSPTVKFDWKMSC